MKPMVSTTWISMVLPVFWLLTCLSHLFNIIFSLVIPLHNLKLLIPSCRQLESLQCEACQLGKHHRVPFVSRRESCVSSAFHLVHYDICGLINNPSLLGFRYFVIFVEDHSRVTHLYLLKEMSKLCSIFKSIFMEVKTQFDASLHIFKFDNAHEYFHTSASIF